MKHYYIGKDGIAHTRKTEFYYDTPIKKLSPQEQELIDICLNCTKKKCNGNCIIIRRKRNETKSRNN